MKYILLVFLFLTCGCLWDEGIGHPEQHSQENTEIDHEPDSPEQEELRQALERNPEEPEYQERLEHPEEPEHPEMHEPLLPPSNTPKSSSDQPFVIPADIHDNKDCNNAQKNKYPEWCALSQVEKRIKRFVHEHKN